MDAVAGRWVASTSAFYGDAHPTYFALAGKLRTGMSASDHADFSDSVASTSKVVFQTAEPGPYGGRMGRGAVSSGAAHATECVSLDNAAVVMVIVFGDSAAPAGEARQIIGAVEH